MKIWSLINLSQGCHTGTRDRLRLRVELLYSELETEAKKTASPSTKQQTAEAILNTTE